MGNKRRSGGKVMYSTIKNVKILISLLKEYKIKHVVMSPGGSDIPIIHSIETDPFFNCYSVVDERSAVYFAIGVANQKNEAVACVCTSGTAVSNYMPGMTEAFYQDVPIVAITADKNPLFTDQIETQKTHQSIFNSVCRKSVDLPIINTFLEEWYCNRLICEALCELRHNGSGPVHINIPTIGNTSEYTENNDAYIRPIHIKKLSDDLSECKKVLEQSTRIMIVVGQNVVFTKDDITRLNILFNKINCVVLVEHMSNLQCDGVVYSYPVTETVGV